MHAFSWCIKDKMTNDWTKMHGIESFTTFEFICAVVLFVCLSNPAKYYVTFYLPAVIAFCKS